MGQGEAKFEKSSFLGNFKGQKKKTDLEFYKIVNEIDIIEFNKLFKQNTESTRGHPHKLIKNHLMEKPDRTLRTAFQIEW